MDLQNGARARASINNYILASAPEHVLESPTPKKYFQTSVIKNKANKYKSISRICIEKQQGHD